MIDISHIPGKAIDAARLAMAEALSRNGDGVPEAIVAAINTWTDARDKIEPHLEAAELRAIAEHAITQWQNWVDAVLTGTSFHGHASAEVEKYRAWVRGLK